MTLTQCVCAHTWFCCWRDVGVSEVIRQLLALLQQLGSRVWLHYTCLEGGKKKRKKNRARGRVWVPLSHQRCTLPASGFLCDTAMTRVPVMWTCEHVTVFPRRFSGVCRTCQHAVILTLLWSWEESLNNRSIYRRLLCLAYTPVQMKRQTSGLQRR